jgi:hypothetical protein
MRRKSYTGNQRYKRSGDEIMNDTIYYKNLYTLAETKKDMVCEHCGKPIMICDRCGIPGWYIMKICKGNGFIHKDEGHFHHCDIKTLGKVKSFMLRDMGAVAFPVLTDDEKRRLDHYKGVENE